MYSFSRKEGQRKDNRIVSRRCNGGEWQHVVSNQLPVFHMHVFQTSRKSAREETRMR